MTFPPLLGEMFAIVGAFCYAFGAVAITKNKRDPAGSGNAVLLSIVVTGVISAVLWALFGTTGAAGGMAFWQGVGFFIVAGVLATVMGRFYFFRSVELAGAIETGLLRRLIPAFAAVLAFVFLGEVITLPTAIGFALVFGAIVLVVLISPDRAKNADGSLRHYARSERERNVGRALAVASAASYGGSFVSRKMAMQTLPDPLAGVCIGALTGIVWFCLAACFSSTYRAYVLDVFRPPSRWQFLSAMGISAGQACQFFALKYTSVTVVAIIGSAEMFIAAWLAAFVIKTEPRPGPTFALASIIALAGIVALTMAPS